MPEVLTVPRPAGRVRRGLSVPLPLAGLGLLLLLWWTVTSQPWLGPRSVLGGFSPQETLPVLWRLLVSGALIEHGLLSLRRVLLGLALATAVGVPLGLMLGSSRSIERMLSPSFHLLRTVSPLSWMPLVIILLGIGDAAVVFLVAVAAVWPVLFSTAAGVQQLERGWVLMARSVGASGRQILTYVVLPAVLPQIVGGVRLAVGLAWVVLVPAEMLGVTSGLGYFLLNTRDRLAYAELMAAILAIGLVGLALDTGVRLLTAALPGVRR
jgi:NitT/TauT family transport system permease protein